MEPEKKRSPLITEEDWWSVWFGFAILAVATIIGFFVFSGDITAKKVPKLGKWVSSPADIFYNAKTTTIELKENKTLAELADLINRSKCKAKANTVEIQDKVQLRILSSRSEAEQTISVVALLEDYQEQLLFDKEEPDPNGLGARAYVSRPISSTATKIGKGKITITAQRDRLVITSLLVSLLCLVLLTSVGIWFMKKNVGKFALAFVSIFFLAILSFGFANFHVSKAYGLSYAAWALVLGLLISNTIGTPKWLREGVLTELYIKTGLVLLGAEILFGKILSLGMPGLIVAWLVTPTVIFFMWLFGTRILKMVSKPLVMIIAAATSVCGVSAAVAVAAASRAKKEELTLAVGMTLIFTVLMMIFMPVFIKFVGMSAVIGGAWMGGTIDSTGAVVAAGAFLGPKAETVAAVVKMIQNVLIGVVGFAVAFFWITSVERDPNAARPSLFEIWHRFPKFIVGFVGASVLFSFVVAPLFGFLFDGVGLNMVDQGVLRAVSNPLRGWFFCLAFVSIGLESNFRDLAKQMEGGKPMVLYVVGQSFNLVLTLAAAWLAFTVLFPECDLTMRPKVNTPRSRRLAHRWLRFLIGLCLFALFFGFLCTAPRPPGLAGKLILRNLDHDVQATALFYSDLECMLQIEQRLNNVGE